MDPDEKMESTVPPDIDVEMLLVHRDPNDNPAPLHGESDPAVNVDTNSFAENYTSVTDNNQSTKDETTTTDTGSNPQPEHQSQTAQSSTDEATAVDSKNMPGQYENSFGMSDSSNGSGPDASNDANLPMGSLTPVPTTTQKEAILTPNLDLLHKIKGMYRMLDLCNDDGSGGIVDKIIIDQESVAEFANAVRPGSYRSITQVDFHSLDKATIRPLGIYGSITAIASFLMELGVVDLDSHELLTKPRTENSGVSTPILRPGIYLLDNTHQEGGLRYIVFWPEDATWEDNSISSVARNRVTFMRYMTKLCDQLVCLISDEHSANLVWKEEPVYVDDKDDDDEDEDSGRQADFDADDRLFAFSVKQTNAESENAVVQPGFSVPHSSISVPTVAPKDFPEDLPLAVLNPRLVVGDVSQAILHVEFLPETQRKDPVNELMFATNLRTKLTAIFAPNIILAETVDQQGLRILLDHGLWSRCGKDLESQWKAQLQSDNSKRHEAKKAEHGRRLREIDSQVSMLKLSMPFYLVDTVLRLYPILQEHKGELLTSVPSTDTKLSQKDDGASQVEAVESWLEKNSALVESKRKEIEEGLQILEKEKKDPYTTLKRRLRRVLFLLEETPELDDTSIQRLVDLINLNPGFTLETTNITARVHAQAQGSKGVFQAITNTVSEAFGKVNPMPTKKPIPLPTMEDIQFGAMISSLIADKPVFRDVVFEIKKYMVKHLQGKIKKLENISHSIGQFLQSTMETEINRQFESQAKQETERAWMSLRGRIQEILASESNQNGATLTIERIAVERNYVHYSAYHYEQFRLEGNITSRQKNGLRYTLRPLEVKADDIDKSSRDRSFICQPIIRTNAQSFILPLGTKIRFAHLVGKDSCLVVLQTDAQLQLYLDHMNSLSTITESKRLKKIMLERVGSECIFAVDETKRLFAILSCHSGSIVIYIYTYDLESRAFGARGGAINISKWYPPSPDLPTFTQIVFVAGTEDLLLIEGSGSCRIYSLVTENFRPSILNVEEPVFAAFSSPEGTCLFLATGSNPTSRIRCFHWASFGSNQGIELDIPEEIPDKSGLVVSSVGQKSAAHLLFLDTTNKICRSLLVQVTCKSSDFNVHSDMHDRFSIPGKPESSLNNSLIDCHAEVWTRFPVYGGAVKRETSKNAVHEARAILFISSVSSPKFSQYFASLIGEFEAKTRKPTRGVLKQIKLLSSNVWPSDRYLPMATSALPLGEWLVGMFCLIPIHLAVTHSNRFNPLKDGMTSPEFERSLLGANVIQIAQALSFGWYDSILSSYFAKKPVKVITSMGEQSVGKSFALNHFVDTSFAGSAMRCTEGVWLSVTPTRDYLVVAMDFEGVHSIERSAQEDTLLVLLNAAVSNFVLFRNNFAMSREIAGLFTSFQSSTNVLDTASNDRLFNGTLGIIIKDVIDSDTKEIVNEFRQKFQRIVQQEQGDNFISKLHNGKFVIVPWPVIESARFYELFGVLKVQLDRQPLTHRHAGAFIGDLKMLMAKLKANDWGALDLNLAAQRAGQLSATLAVAMAFGTNDLSTGEPLKHFDTDETIPGPPQNAVFYLDAIESLTGNSSSLFLCLSALRKSFPEYFERFQMDEEEFILRLTTYLQSLVSSRIEYVNEWLKINTERFGGKIETIKLFREFDNLAKELRAGVAICRSKCSMCGLLCVEHKLHTGSHDCKTSHKCPQICSFTEQHVTTLTIPACSLPAAHSGRHVCSETPHLCDAPCQLRSRDGCLGICSKPTDHDDDEEHLCATKVHACGEPCSLVQSDGVPICNRLCVVDCRREHQQHTCDRSMSCPVPCQLCSSFCAAGDHFHALTEGAIHLCGQTHACRELCQQLGICRIATTPQSVECNFTGRHSQFQFTKYTQEAERLHCIIRIEADEVSHKGPHQHSLDSAAFHHCEERCRHCGYYCTLPLNHSQNQHETSHGSMAQTQWVVDGDENAALELQGRKYATGDSGAPMLCSMICKTLGRHAHIDRCRPDEHGTCVGGAGIEHVQRRCDINEAQDWITHRLFWARSGFKDPYTNTEQADFDLCDHRCGGEEHDPDVNPGGVPSHCVLPLFHSPANATNAPVLGHASTDGHAYHCKNPAQMQRSFHIFFALDRSGSMAGGDRRPLPNSPATQRIVQRANNRFGAVVSSLYGFWTARDAAIRSGGAGGMRRDAYTIIPFDSTASTLLANDTTSDPDRLLENVLSQRGGYGGTNFTHALQTVQREMERSWVTERSPIVVFLSDGECQVADEVVYDLCRRAVTLGKPLSLHAVSFGTDAYSNSLRRMVAIAGEVYTAAPRDPLAPGGNPCTFSAALDTIQLADTFMSIAASLKNPRAALSRV